LNGERADLRPVHCCRGVDRCPIDSQFFVNHDSPRNCLAQNCIAAARKRLSW
jgi:hypothetical protein